MHKRILLLTFNQVGDNGIISFSNSYNYWKPSPLPLNGSSFIAPYWADFDLRGTGQISYRQTKNISLLARATHEIQTAFALTQNWIVTNLLIVTWNAVGYYNNKTDKVL